LGKETTAHSSRDALELLDRLNKSCSADVRRACGGSAQETGIDAWHRRSRHLNGFL
jgi:hypothetical protein